MPVEAIEARDTKSGESDRVEARSSGDEGSAAPSTTPASGRQFTRKRKLLAAVLGALVLAGTVWGIPWIRRILNTISTDDAYVNGHVTFVAPRVAGQISQVLVDDNYRVHVGDLLAELDKEPYRIAVAEKQAAVDTAQADLAAATAAVRGIEAQTRSDRWKLQRAVEDVDNRIAQLHARVAALEKTKAALTLAQLDFDRAKQLVQRDDVSRAEYDRRQAQLTTAAAGVTQAIADIRQVRAALGLPVEADKDGDLSRVPPDLDQNFSAILEAQSDLIQSAAQLGVVHSYNQSPTQMLAAFEGQGDIDRTFDRLAVEAPAVKQAQAKLEAAQRDLAQAELDLRYCDITATIDGVVTRRNVNPGNYVQVGQNLMAVRSLSEIWVDANFKETELRDMRIGQAVDLYVDMYGGRRVFKGHVGGFTMGTGSTLALLPAENATGNFIKVVQRLPVRLELDGYDSDRDTLFIGTSVTPYVYVNQPPTGPDAGKLLQSRIAQPQNAAPLNPADSH